MVHAFSKKKKKTAYICKKLWFLEQLKSSTFLNDIYLSTKSFHLICKQNF